MFRGDIAVDIESDKDFCFQILDWYSVDVEVNESKHKKYIIKLFGNDEDGNSVSVNVTGFKTYFYITCKKAKLSALDVSDLKRVIVSNIHPTLCNDLEIVTVSKKTLWGFTNNEKRQYIKLKFSSISSMYSVRKFLSRYEKTNNSSLTFGSTTSHIKFHESNVEPILRFIHMRNIQPGGWIRLQKYEKCNKTIPAKTQINLTTSWKSVFSFENTKIAPFIVMSFDIECTSSHGDFPMAKKTYNKSANELVDYYNRVQDVYDFRNLIITALQSMFDDKIEGYLSIVYTKEPVDIVSMGVQINKHVDDILKILENKIQYTKDEKSASQKCVQILETKLNKLFPDIEGDPVIQIGTTLHRYGETTCFYKNIITLGTCDDIDGIDVVVCETEEDVINEWCRMVNRIDPDIITGYNILGFDFSYMYQRSEELECSEDLLACSRLCSHDSVFREKNLSSSALGDNTLKYVEMEGRVVIDIMKVVQRDHKLDSYKLDNVVNSFINGKVKKVDGRGILVENTTGLNTGDYIYLNNQKYKIDSISGKQICLNKPVDTEQPVTQWGLAKDDVTPKEIFRCQKGSSSDRALVAKYCVQDSALCNSIMVKLEIIANNLGMANVCMVPMSYIFLRGQGVKIFSLVANQCRGDNIIIPTLKYDPDVIDAEGYEGAIVLDPTPGVYVEAPISVMDYASLYPSSMISENISHDSIVLDEKYDNLEGFEYVDVTYDIFTGIGDKKEKTGEKVCRYAQFPDNEKGVLPRILMKLLSQRKATRKKIEHKCIEMNDNISYVGFVDTEDNTHSAIKTVDGDRIVVITADIRKISDVYNDFMKAVLDGLQLAYKVTANSLYGSVGAPTSQIYMKELAASTTATGRNLIIKAKKFMEANYDADVIYGDTDSIFVDFKVKEKFNLTDRTEVLQKSIDISVEASREFRKELKHPHDLEYEKTFFPFIILSKKKYVGNLYEHDVTKYKQKSMGIVLKRRDNANIVKRIYGGIIDILLGGGSVNTSISFLKKSLRELIDGNYGMSDLIITKTLRKTYADPSKIAHKVLADRMFERDPGSAPQVNERVPYVYVEYDQTKKSLLQGDKIEDPTFITENKIKINYTFYITNQISNPVCQLLALCLFDIPKSKSRTYYRNKEASLVNTYTLKKTKDKINVLKQKEVHELLFSPILHELNNEREGHRPLTQFFKRIDTPVGAV
jgi:DNA polymerase elongation subunit (family B)